ncbi:hypothetical protein R3P38DRAFT_3221620 [Favolaschia claudopus]|uniref:Uncharacterized protein n=1 Tax=Favolaschia claudopus TaxID=2862362 RepID=A0AAW0A0R7_9AGAR
MPSWIASSNPCIALLDCLVRGFLSEAAEKILDFGEFRRGSGTTNLNVCVVVLSQTLTSVLGGCLVYSVWLRTQCLTES